MSDPTVTLVTGAAGFIGSHLVDRLLSRGETVVGYDNFDDFYDPAIKRSNLASASENARFTLVQADIRDQEALTDTLRVHGVQRIVHLAARAGVRPSIQMPRLYADVNVGGTISVLDAAREANVPRVVYASSSSVYGGRTKVPFSEADPVDTPISPYAATKKATELIAHTYHHLYGLETVGLRFFTVYGPRQRPEMAIHKFTRLIDAGEQVPMFGGGDSKRDYTYIDDIIDGVVAAIERGKPGGVYNLGESHTTSLSELIELIGKALGKSPRVDRQPEQPGDVPITYADISLAKTELGYDPQVLVDQGIPQFVAWFKAERATAADNG